MPYLELEPDELRRMAREHDALAAKIRKWGEIPDNWLGEFESSYGSIADPVRGALSDYYRKRHDKAERRAAHHELTRDNLYAAADRMEAADQGGGGLVDRAGGGSGSPTTTPTPTPTPTSAPPPALPGTPPVPSGHPERPAAPSPSPVDPVSSPGHPGAPAAPDAAAPTPVPAAGPGVPTSAAPGSPIVMPGPVLGAGPGNMSAPPVSPAGRTDPPASDIGRPQFGAVGSAPVPAGVDGASNALNAVPTPSAGDPLPPTPVGPGAGPALLPAPLAAGPFVAAVEAGREHGSPPPFVVGASQDDDLVLARTLVAAVRAATAESAPRVGWAVAVLRVGDRPRVLLTSTEGRGWLPPGLFLPSEVMLPWKWDTVFGPAARRAMSALEGTADPARILVAFGRAVPRGRGARISALASSEAISDELRAELGAGIATADRVAAAASAVDLSAPGAGLEDRLAVAGSQTLLEQAARMPDSEIPERCLELARSADVRVRAAVSILLGESPAGRDIPRRAAEALSAGGPATPGISADWSAAGRPAGADIRSDPAGADVLRAATFERRADEIGRLLAAAAPNRQTLRDVLYAYGQIVDHPGLPTGAGMVTTSVPAGATTAPVLEFSRSVTPVVSEPVSQTAMPSASGLPRPSPNR